MKKSKFFDTSSLLHLANKLDKEENIIISSITLEEIENIKTSSTKDEETKYRARQVLQYIRNTPDISFVIFKEPMLEPIIQAGFSVNNDAKIIACALSLKDTIDFDFITSDFS
jgi:hypothetical protein